jgi:uncharacterized protein (TIGR02118 family)
MYVSYSGSSTARFDRNYYIHKHLPLVVEAWGPYGLKTAVALFPVDNSESEMIAVAVCEFENDEALRNSLASEASDAVMRDVGNYTDLTPIQTVGGPVPS